MFNLAGIETVAAGPSLLSEKVFRRALGGQFCISSGLEVKVRRKLRLEGISAD